MIEILSKASYLFETGLSIAIPVIFHVFLKIMIF